MQIKAIMDLQYGSTGKGLLAGRLAYDDEPDCVMTAWAPNAGHTFIDFDGRKYVHTHVANGVVSPRLTRLMLGPGSVIDPAQLRLELESVTDRIPGVRVMIHPSAAVVHQRHRDEEKGPMTKIGSTKKGVGAAMIERIRRDPETNNSAGNEPSLREFVVTPQTYRHELRLADRVQIEGAQGYGLSMYHGFYPYTTSRDVSTWQMLADVGMPNGFIDWKKFRVIGTARTYPIRVAHRYDEQGRMVGNSGPVYDDQKEISFEDIGQPVELTTVTKLPRRIFTFSARQIEEAVEYNGVTHVFLNFGNYCQSADKLREIAGYIINTGAWLRYIGMGPAVYDVHTVYSHGWDQMNDGLDFLWSKYATR
jgi:adenylosuccinate synthase